MKKVYRFSILVIAIFIMTVNTEKGIAQNDPPWVPDQHGFNGDQSTHAAPLDGGSDVLILLGIGYAIKQVSNRKRKKTVTR